MDQNQRVPAYYPGLNGLRGLAMLVVFVNHYNPRPTSRLVSFFSIHGWCGVQIFFVLSGFLITGTLWDSRLKSHRWRDFYGRRVLRIFPVYYAFWLVILLLQPVIRAPWNWGWLLYVVHLANYIPLRFDTPANHLYLRVMEGASFRWTGLNFGHFWSLCVEEQFYFVWPWLVYRCSSRESLRRLCIAVITTAILLRLAMLFGPAHLLQVGMWLFSMPTQMDGLALGGLIAVMLRGKEATWIRSHNGRIVLALLAAPAFYIPLYASQYGFQRVLWTNLLSQIALPCANLLGAALVLRATHHGSEVQRLLSWRPLAAFGTITYCFYVIHTVPQRIYTDFAAMVVPGPLVAPVTFVLAFVVSLLVAMLSFRFYEGPLLKLKRHFGHQVHRAPTA